MRFLALFLLVSTLLVGCGKAPIVTTQIVDSEGKVIEQPEATVNTSLPKGEITIIPGKTDLVAGVPGMIGISIHNSGASTIELAKWHIPESANLIFHYIPCNSVGDIPLDTKPEDWTSQVPVINHPRYYPLILMSGNSTYIWAELSFVENLPLDFETSHYLVIVEINQEDFKVAGLPFVITVYGQ